MNEPRLRLEFTIPAGVNPEQVDAQIAKVLVAMSDLHRAMGGSGLKIVQQSQEDGEIIPLRKRMTNTPKITRQEILAKLASVCHS